MQIRSGELVDMDKKKKKKKSSYLAEKESHASSRPAADMKIEIDRKNPLDKVVAYDASTDKHFPEGAKAYKAFLDYVEWRSNNPTGEYRPFRQFAKDNGYSEKIIYTWSRVWRWQERASAYDRVCLESITESLKSRRIKAYRNQLVAADRMLAKALKAMDNRDISEIEIRDVLNLVDSAVKIQRQVFGDPTEIIAQEIGTRNNEPIQFSIADLMATVGGEDENTDADVEQAGGAEE